MPTYDYVCEACDHAFEEFQSITAKSLRKCPECGKNKLKRLIGTGSGVIFKGSGFYETDYRSDSYKKAAKADSDSSSSSSTSTSGDSAKGDSSAKTESKKTETKAEKPTGKSGSGDKKK